MATLAKVSVSEYLESSYRPDQELVDGQLIERNVGEYEHSNLQGALVVYLRQRQREWNIRVLPEQRIQVSASRFRVPDVTVISREQSPPAIFTSPPLLCIEVLSRNDTLNSMQARIDDYLAFGVPNIWVLDPLNRRAYVCKDSGNHELRNGELKVPESSIQISLQELFSELD